LANLLSSPFLLNRLTPIVPSHLYRDPLSLHDSEARRVFPVGWGRAARLGLISSACALLLQACGGGGADGSTATSGSTGSGSSANQEMSATLPAGTTLIAGSGCDLSYSITSSPVLVGTDPDLASQWHLDVFDTNTASKGAGIEAVSAWTLTKGQGIVVGVIDDAVEVSHRDLQANLVDGSVSFRKDNPSGYPIPCLRDDDDHGTAVAGILAARDGNGLGGAGVAPRASLVAYDALATSRTADIVSALTSKNQTISIYQNSWGSPDTGAVSDSGPAFARAIEDGINLGRGGLGSIFVFSGGNGGETDNTNLDGFANRRGIIAVCGVDREGRKMQFVDAGGSEPGANLLVCAPGIGITTTGLNSGMRNDFSGASAATPMVSGVAALMLSVNPSLTWRDVPIILARTAKRNDSADRGWVRSPAGLWVHPYYGFGVVNALDAVSLAKRWTSVGGSSSQKRCDSDLATVNNAIPDYPASGLEVGINLNCPGITAIEFVEVQVTTSHAYHGDLRIELVSPQGGVSELVQDRTCDTAIADPCGAFSGWTFGSVRHLDEPAAGRWTLRVSDRARSDTGSLQSWRVVVYGR